jgi:succinoglycan biosynthesis transport protein ExoP
MTSLFAFKGLVPPFVNGHRNGYLSHFHQTASLFFSPSQDNSLQLALITSAWSGEGTTTVVLGMAKALRDTCGTRVLAVEINSARPTLAKLFNVPSDRSLAAVASGSIAPGDAFFEVEPGFSVLPVGEDAVAVRGALVRVLRQVIAAGQGQFDTLLIDAPPLLQSTDALVAGSVARRLVLVVEAARTSSESLQRIARRLEQEGISLIGSVLNKEKPCMPGWLYRRLSR